MRASLLGIAIAIGAGARLLCPAAHEGLGRAGLARGGGRALGPLLDDPAVLKIFHDAKFDMMAAGARGLPARGAGR